MHKYNPPQPPENLSLAPHQRLVHPPRGVKLLEAGSGGWPVLTNWDGRVVVSLRPGLRENEIAFVLS